MTAFVLVHGSWHGAWCWYKIVPLLEKAGHKAIAVDLPAHGKDKSPIREVTLQSNVDRVCEVIDSLDEPVVLVGHSRGGITITQIAEQRPGKIENLVYLAAFLIPDGQTMLPLALGDKESLIMPNLTVNREQGWDMLHEDAFKEALYSDCSEDDISLAKLLLTPEPLAPFATPIHTTRENFGRIPRSYIELLDDRAVSSTLQRQMYTAMPCEKVISMKASHSAYFSQPENLANHLQSI